MALYVALELEKQRDKFVQLGVKNWTFLSGGTDGRDGPTDAAGAIVDTHSLSRMRARGCDPLDALARNDSYGALETSGDLIKMPATGTNVADIQLLLIQLMS